jgi:hypothetical protein
LAAFDAIGGIASEILYDRMKTQRGVEDRPFRETQNIVTIRPTSRVHPGPPDA